MKKIEKSQTKVILTLRKLEMQSWLFIHLMRWVKTRELVHKKDMNASTVHHESIPFMLWQLKVWKIISLVQFWR